MLYKYWGKCSLHASFPTVGLPTLTDAILGDGFMHYFLRHDPFLEICGGVVFSSHLQIDADSETPI